MSQRKDSTGWQPPEGIKFRQGQQQVINLLRNPQSRPRQTGQLIAELPTGYGKTFVICASYALLRNAGEVGRVLIIVPSTEQFDSYLEEVESHMAMLGHPITGALSANSLLSLKAHRTNQAEVYVATIHTLSNGGGALINDLLSTGKWLLAADEYHRYAESNTWGKAVAGLNTVFTLAVSATPDRTDKAQKAIKGAPDVRVTLKEAVDEGAIRPVVIRTSDYAVDVTMRGQDTPQRFTTKDLTEALAGSGADISSQEVKLELRYFSKYLHKALLDAWGRLLSLNSESNGQHKMLVFALGVGHAKSICEQMNAIAEEKVADWIGVQSTICLDDGSTKAIGRPEKENKAVLDAFKAGDFSVLVQVRKATEGFNDPCCSVLLFLNMTCESVQLKQMIGRGLRRNYKVEPDTGTRAKKDKCWIYVSFDHPGLEYMKRLECDLADTDEGPDQELSGDQERLSSLPIYRIPEFFILDASFRGEELFYPFGDGMVSQSEAAAKARQLPALANEPDEVIQAHLRRMFGMDPKPISTTQRLDDTRRSVTKAAQTLASNVVRIRAERSGGTFVKSLLGDTNKVIHRRWLSKNPKLTHDNMTPDEMESKYQWIKEVNDGIQAASDPYAHLLQEQPWLLL
jgi:superfamily II DNA or RNA helicase